MEINREIEKYTKQKFFIIFVNKEKERLQTPTETSKQVQLSTWKKQRFDLPANLSYHYTPRNTINITSVFTASITTLLNRILFKSNQNNLNTTLIVAQNLFPVIMIDSPLAPPIAKQQQQQPQLPSQQKQQQQLQLQLQQQLPLASMAYAPITKIEKFTGKKDNA
ncbi:hypothetical protein G9A89_013024 [Geosiphon pyriformis]|nr:hypothetical protein G9A89_013024 [Geosiphon pyriformis]